MSPAQVNVEMEHKHRLSRSLQKAVANLVPLLAVQDNVVVRAASTLTDVALQACTDKQSGTCCLHLQCRIQMLVIDMHHLQ